MKQKATLKRLLMLVMLMTVWFSGQSQNYVPFGVQYNTTIKGDMLQIGNNVMNRDSGSNGPNVPYNGTDINDNLNMQYIDIDSDALTFNSSSANLTIPSTNVGCYKIQYAMLYWAGVYNENDINDEVDRNKLNEVKFKMPSGAYVTLTGTLIYDSYPTTVSGNNRPGYAAYYDVTTMLQGLADANGTYTVANVQSGLGNRTSGGWSLFIVYEDPAASAKNITLFDGFSGIQGTNSLNIPMSGFTTIPVGPVRAKLAFAALEGDYGISGDRLRINGTSLTIPTRPADNFFNSTINDINGAFTTRVPNSGNTLGYDSGVLNILNPGNTVIGNNQTSATVQLQTSGDAFVYFMNAFAIEVIQPQINLIKNVKDLADVDIANSTVNLGEEIYYELDFQNVGNDDAINFTITDVLPSNVTFLPADLVLPPGVTYTFDAATNTLVFTIPNSLVTEGGALYQIRIKVKVVESCEDIKDACSNEIQNLAYKTYSSLNSGNLVENQAPSASSIDSCMFMEPGTTNFIVDIDDCVFEEDIVLCGGSVPLTGSNGYTSYQWHNGSPPTAANAIPGATSQTFNAGSIGTYVVVETAPAPCLSIVETFNVVDFNSTVIPNPLIPSADTVVTCPNDGQDLCKYYLCGGEKRLIKTTSVNASIIIWEQLDESSCAAVTDTNCPNTNTSCTWNHVGSGVNYNVGNSGQYRMRVVYPNGCFRTFYFNVYKNEFTPTFSSTDIICNTNGSITINGVPPGYEFSIVSDAGPWQPSNVFTVSTAGVYTVYVKPIGDSVGACIYELENIQVLERQFDVDTTVTQPLCYDDKGSIRVQVNNVEPQYTYELYQGATLVNAVGPINGNDYTFPNLNPGTYTVNASTSDGCAYTETITIVNPPLLTLTGAVTIPLMCTDGEITAYPSGGTPPYTYTISGTAGFQAVPEFTITTPGTYTLTVTDNNNCTATTDVIIDQLAPPTYTVDITNILCFGDASGQIVINVSNTNGFALQYSIDNGTTYGSNPVFSNLTAGTYNVLVQYSLNGVVCTDTVQPVTITEPTQALSATAEVTELAGCGPNGEGKVHIINPQGGTAPYQYSFDNGVTYSSTNEAYLQPGSYTLYVQDANGCVYPMPITIDPAPLDPTITIAAPSYNCDGTATVSVAIDSNGSSFTYTYLIDGVVNTNVPANEFVNVACGNHTITIQYQSATGPFPLACTTQVEYPIYVECNQEFTAQITSTSNVTCNGVADGQITIAAQNFEATNGFYYSIDNGTTWVNAVSSPVIITGLVANTYNVLVQYDLSATPCSFTFTQVITEPTALVGDATLTSPATCITGGTITATASGGTPNYQFQLEDNLGNILVAYQSNGVFSNLTAGDYIVVVRDALGCTDSIDAAITIATPTPPTATVDASSDLCYDGSNAATIVITASSGVAPYQYNINGGAYQSSNIFSGLTPGNYNITVVDAYGCSVAVPTVTIAPQLLATISLASNLNCTTSPDAVINGTITGGTAPYTYQVAIDGGALSAPVSIAGTTFTYTTPNPGSFQFTITDALGCTYTNSAITVNPLPVLNAPVLAITNQILCNGDENGAISVSNSGGLPPYTTNVYNTTTGTDYGTQTSGLAAGDYIVTVTDANACTATANITIIQPDPITFDITKTDIQCGALGTEPGAIDVINVSGGTQPYVYTLSNSEGYIASYATTTNENHSFTILDFGVYIITVVDANGCTLVEDNIFIASPPNSLNIDLTIATTDCTAGGTAVVSLNPTVVGGPYYFAVYQGAPYPTYPSAAYQPADTAGGLSSTFTGLTPGVVYSFIVYDATTNCYFFETASGPIPTLSAITSTVTPNNVTCTGSDDGSVSFTISGYSGTSVTYQIYSGLSNTPVGTAATLTGLTGSPATVSNFGALPPGIYYVLFTENDGPYAMCTQTSDSFTILESPVLLSLTANVTKNDNCNVNAGQISVIGANGTAPYEYQLVPAGGTAPTQATWAGQISSVFNVEGGDYDVYILDAYGCIQTVPITLPTDTAPAITLAIDGTTTCNNNEGNFAMVITRDNTVGVAPFTYSIDGAAFNTYVEDASYSFVISGLNSGTHTVTVQDANGCTDTQTITIDPPLNGTAGVTFAAVQNCGISDGIITVNAAGGTGNYTYSITPNVAPITSAGNVFSNVPSGSYVVTITDTVTNCSFDVNVTITAPQPPVFNSVVNDVTCNLGTDGVITINLTASNIDPIYTYEITAPIVVAPQTSNVFTGLAAGTYTVMITSGRGCTTTADVVVNEAPAIVVPAPTVTEFACTSGNAMNNAIIVVNGVTGGSGTYINYEFIQGGVVLQSGNNNTYVESNTQGGTYTINVYDNNGCLGSTTAVINPFIAISLPSAAVTVTTPITCTNDEAITINVTTTGGTPASLNYTVTGLNGNPYNVTQTSPDFTGLTVGNYSIIVENPTTGCIAQTVHYVLNPNTFTISATVVNNVTCFGGTDGTVEFTFIDSDLTPTDDAGPFTYDIVDTTGAVVASGTSPSAGPFSVGNLPSGIYEIQATLTSSPFCPATIVFSIAQPSAALAISTSSTPITCVATSDDGSISAVGTNGWGAPYEYQLELGGSVVSAWSSTSTFSGLTAGTYTVSVRDNVGCVVSEDVTLTIPAPISATLSASTTSLPCLGDTSATITVTNVSGGQGSGYLYVLTNTVTGLSTAPQQSNVFANLGAGTYEVTVTDSFTCTFTTTSVTITEPATNATGSLTMTSTPTCLVDAVITLTATGGTAPYQYSTSPSGPFAPLSGGSMSFNVTAGTYQYYITDANNCVVAASNQIIVEPVNPVVVTVDTANAFISCNGGTATVYASAEYGLGNYTYQLLPVTAGVVQTTPGIFENVPAGTYTVQVTSGDCVGTSASFTITEPTPITYTASSTDLTCFDSVNGTITVVATGGTGLIQYSISSAPNESVNSGTFINLLPGDYTVYVQDQAGCTIPPIEFTILQPDPIELDGLNIQSEVCFGDGGTISFSVIGGTTTTTDSNGNPMNIGYTATDGTTTLSSLTGDFTFTGLPSGDNVFMVSDANGCTLDFLQTLDPGVDVQEGFEINYNCIDNAPGNEVIISVNSSVPLSEFTFSLDGNPSQVSNIFTNVSAGAHTVTVEHINGCVKELTFNIVSYSSPVLSLAETGLNQFTATTVGGAGGYQYYVDNVAMGSTNVFLINHTGTYVVMVEDANGCQDVQTIFMTFYDVEIPNYFTPDGDGNNDGWSPRYTDNYPNMVSYIFDRYGRKIMTLKPGQSWDGTYNNNLLPTGDYWYVVKLNGEDDTREFVGNFTLYR